MSRAPSHTYVCFGCKRVGKSVPGIITPKCPICAQYMLDCGSSFKTPRRKDDRGWTMAAGWARLTGRISS